VPPPGANGTITRTVRTGYSSAAFATDAARTTAANAACINVLRIMPPRSGNASTKQRRARAFAA